MSRDIHLRSKLKVAPVFTKLRKLAHRLSVTANKRISEYLSRRPHRSFRRTRRRDYQRSLAIPGYWAFTFYVVRVLLQNKRLFGGLLISYVLLGMAFVGLSSQDAYAQLSDLIDETGSGVFGGGWGVIGQSGLLLLSALSGSFNPKLTDTQQIYAALLLLLTWLTTVWALRSILAGKKPRLRDALYNAGSPIVATGIIFFVVLIQLLPAAIAVMVFNSAMTTNLFDSGFIAMMISIIASLLIVLSLYWVVSGFLAMIIVTLPGMYPWQALRAAGDMAVGRRVRILLRLLWMMACGLVAWVIVVLPVILLVRFITGLLPVINAVPIVPFVMACMSSFVTVWAATYVYLLYRKIVEDDAKPA